MWTSGDEEEKKGSLWIEMNAACGKPPEQGPLRRLEQRQSKASDGERGATENYLDEKMRAGDKRYAFVALWKMVVAPRK